MTFTVPDPLLYALGGYLLGRAVKAFLKTIAKNNDHESEGPTYHD